MDSYSMATVIVDELHRCGSTDVCVSPGSRSAPLALAFADSGAFRVHVFIDERSASFAALGIAKVSRRPVAVVCTSGSAAANFHPAVVEADHSDVPLILLTADRPPELRDTGAGQTIDQVKMYGSSVRWYQEVGPAEGAGSDGIGLWRSIASRAFAKASGDPSGPVHLNVCFREPLVPNDESLEGDLGGRPTGDPWTSVVRGERSLQDDEADALAERLAAVDEGLVVAGYGADAAAAASVSEATGWPLIAEAVSGARSPAAISTYDALARCANFAATHRPRAIIRLGVQGTSRAFTAMVGRDVDEIVLASNSSKWLDPSRSASLMVRADPASVAAQLSKRLESRPGAWSQEWSAAEAAARGAMDATIDSYEELTEPGIARDVPAAIPAGSLLSVASSMPIRDLDWFMRPTDGIEFLANRGANGIDGFVSTCIGAAQAWDGPAFALLGDLAMLHDQNGLLSIGDVPTSLTFVVVNNNGGGIFSFLPQAALPDHFERLFGTSHSVSFETIASAAHIGYSHVTSPAELRGALADGSYPGVRIIELRTDRARNVEVHNRIWQAVEEAVPAL